MCRLANLGFPYGDRDGSHTDRKIACQKDFQIDIQDISWGTDWCIKDNNLGLKRQVVEDVNSLLELLFIHSGFITLLEPCFHEVKKLFFWESVLPSFLE